MANLRTLLFFGAAGAAAMYFFDPDRGEGRRARAREQFGGMVQRGRGQAMGVMHQVSPKRRKDEADDDLTIRDRAESTVFGRHGFKGGNIHIEVVNGVLTLRGQIDSEREIQELVVECKAVPGVVDVVNLLHVPGEVPPNKKEARRAAAG